MKNDLEILIPNGRNGVVYNSRSQKTLGLAKTKIH